jgi:uncharacterized protein with von Willebrand factor type A (vWA) domain
VAFTRVLRRCGLRVAPDSTTTFASALGVGGFAPDAVYWAGRAVFVHRPEDIGRYDEAFVAFWSQARPIEMLERLEQSVPIVSDDPDGEGGGAQDEGPVRVVRYSATETLRDKDFAACSPEELAEVARGIERMQAAVPHRRTRRMGPSRRRHGRADVRATFRHALRTDGVPIRRLHLEAQDRPRRVVMVCDVSGSMQDYARVLLRFLHVAVAAGEGRTEAFALGTGLTRISRQLWTRDPDAALRAASAAVPDFSGGTRLGAGLRTFNDRFGVHGMARGAVVVILSDGWDRGDLDVLAAEMERLHRASHRLIWVNPLKASPGYQPLARGMATALAHVDDFVAGHSLASLEDLLALIERTSAPGSGSPDRSAGGTRARPSVARTSTVEASGTGSRKPAGQVQL